MLCLEKQAREEEKREKKVKNIAYSEKQKTVRTVPIRGTAGWKDKMMAEHNQISVNMKNK